VVVTIPFRRGRVEVWTNRGVRDGPDRWLVFELAMADLEHREFHGVCDRHSKLRRGRGETNSPHISGAVQQLQTVAGRDLAAAIRAGKTTITTSGINIR
jgi:hypothetical protein